MTPPIKREHLQTVLKLLLQHPGATRPQLCQLTGLTPSAMHGIITLLQEKELIDLMGAPVSSGGRPAGQYRLKPSLGYVMGISIRLDQISAGLFSMDLQPLREITRPLLLPTMGPESYTLLIAEMAEELFAQSQAAKSNCLGLGVILPGPVRLSDGVVQQICGAPLWQGFPLVKRLSDALALPVIADKDVYAGVEYLHFTHQIQHPDCAAYLSICEGIGSALMLNGKAFRGGHSLSGEIGHLTVRKEGLPCRCGNTGCLELYCSDIGLVKQYNAQSGENCTNVEEVLQRMDSGDAAASAVLTQAIGNLVDTTSSIIMAYDPKELLIYCRWLSCQKNLYFQMLDVLYAKSIFTQKHQADIRLLPPDAIYLPASATLALSGLILKEGSALMKQM